MHLPILMEIPNHIAPQFLLHTLCSRHTYVCMWNANYGFCIPWFKHQCFFQNADWPLPQPDHPVVSPLKNVSPTKKKNQQKCCFFGLLHCNLRSSGDYIALRVISVIHSSLSLEVIDSLNYSMPHDKLVKVLEVLPTGKELDAVNFF